MAKKLSKVKKVDKKQLGSGIHAIFTTNKLEEQIEENPEELVKELANKFANIPINEIQANPDQPRQDFPPETLEELSDSIKLHGIIQPITVRRLSARKYQIISGERRFRASKMAELEEIPAYIRIADDQQMLEMAIIENIQRENLNAFDIAVSYHRLKEEFNLTDEVLAQRVGKDRVTITHYLGILNMHPEVIEALKKEQISMGHAKAIKGIDDKLLQKEVLKEIIKKELSVRKAESLKKKYSKPSKKAPVKKKQLPVEYEEIVSDFRAFFGNKQIKLELEGKENGRITIPFNNNEELMHYFKMVEQ